MVITKQHHGISFSFTLFICSVFPDFYEQLLSGERKGKDN